MVESGESVVCEFTSEELGPTAGDAVVAGRVADAGGRGVRGIALTLIDPQSGETRHAVTNNMGHYSFDQLEVGTFYVVTAFARKRFSITDPVRAFTLNEDLLNVDFLVEGGL